MKGASERVKGKNLRPFCGEPLFFKIAKVLQSLSFIDKILINTDSKEIAELAKFKFNKVKIINRPKHLIGHDVPMNEIIAYDLTQTDESLFLQTHSTNPLLQAVTLENAWGKFLENDAHNSLFSVTMLQTRLYDKNLKPVNHNPEELIKTQDLPPVYEENSNFYFFTRNSFFIKKRRISENFQIFPIDKLEAFDIDNEVDFILAELAYKTYRESNQTLK
jgi:CMP-N-acetylneuraminic acid synthetase